MDELMEADWDCNLFYCVVRPGEELVASKEAVETHSSAGSTGVTEGTSLSDAVNKVKEKAGFRSGDKVFGLRLRPPSWIDVTDDAPSSKPCKKGTHLHFKVVPAQLDRADESSKLEHVVALLKKLVLGQSRLEQGLHASLWLTFWGEIASTVTSETTVQFKKILVDYYGDAEDKSNMCDEKQPLRCMVTDLRLPGKWIAAAHLLGRKHSTKAHVFGFHDIDDPRNGFLWNRAMEEAYSLFQIVFSWDAAANSFHIHVLDKALTGQKISGIKLRKPFNRSLDHYIDAQTKQQFDEMTFDDLQGKLVSFNNLNRPFKRVLCLHAKLGIRKAKEEKYLPAGLDLGQYNFDYWTETTDSILLQTFLEDSQPWIKESDLEGLSSASADTP